MISFSLKRSRGPVLFLIAAVAATPLFCHSAWGSVWENTGTDWNTAGNWSTTVPGPGLGQNATFNVAEGTNPALSASSTAAGINFSTAGASGYNISSADPSYALTLTSYGSTGESDHWAIYAQNTSGTNTISAPLVLDPYYGGTTRNISVFGQAHGGTLVLSGNIGQTGTATDLWLVGDQSGGTFDITGTNNSYVGGTGNTALGGTVIARDATVEVASLGMAGANGSLGWGSITLGSTAIVDGSGAGPATLVYQGVGETSDKTITVSVTSTIDTTGATGALILTGPTITSNAAAGNLRLAGNTAGNRITSNILNNGGNSLTKSGTGGWELAGTNTYTGATLVSGGTLLITGSQANSTHTVTSAVDGGTAVLGGTGTIGGAVILSTPTGTSRTNEITGGGVGSIGTLTIANTLTANTGSTLYFDVGAGTNNSDELAGMTAIPTINGHFTLNFLAGSFVKTTDDLLTWNTSSVYDSTQLAAFESNWTLNNAPAGATLSFTSTPGKLTLNISGIVSAVPEPASLALLAVGALALLVRRKRVA